MTIIAVQLYDIHGVSIHRSTTLQITLPANYTCDQCTLQLLRQASEWSAGNSQYIFWSCAKVSIQEGTQLAAVILQLHYKCNYSQLDKYGSSNFPITWLYSQLANQLLANCIASYSHNAIASQLPYIAIIASCIVMHQQLQLAIHIFTVNLTISVYCVCTVQGILAMAIPALGMGHVPMGSVLAITLTVAISVSTRVSNANTIFSIVQLYDTTTASYIILFIDDCVDVSDCSNHGECIDIQATGFSSKPCFCNPRWFGRDCSRSKKTHKQQCTQLLASYHG